MTDSNSTAEHGDPHGGRLQQRFIRWGGLAALLGPLLVLAANGYGLWATRTYGGSPEAYVETATTTASMAFGGIRLVGGLLLVFGLVALYLYQLEEAGGLGLVGFVVSMVGTVLLTAVAWFAAFADPVLAQEVPEFFRQARAGEVGTLLFVGVLVPSFVQAIGWTIFGVATYRAGVFPRRAAVVLVVGALLLFVPVQGIPVVFQLAVAWLGFLLFTGRVERSYDEEPTGASRSRSASR